MEQGNTRKRLICWAVIAVMLCTLFAASGVALAEEPPIREPEAVETPTAAATETPTAAAEIPAAATETPTPTAETPATATEAPTPAAETPAAATEAPTPTAETPTATAQPTPEPTAQPLLFDEDWPRVRLSELAVLSNSVNAPGTLQVRLDVMAELYVVTEIELIYVHTGSGGPTVLRQDIATPMGKGTHTVDVAIPDYLAAGQYEFVYLTTVNSMGDTVQYNRSIHAGNSYIDETARFDDSQRVANTGQMDFTVGSAANADTVSPQIGLGSLAVSPKTVNVPGEVEISFDLVEGGSGLTELHLTFESLANPGTMLSFPLYLDTPLKTGSHTVKQNIPQLMIATGDYTFVDAFLLDGVGNSTWLDVAGGTITQTPDDGSAVTSAPYTGGWDFSAIALDAMTINPAGTRLVQNSVTAPGILELEIEILDAGTGVESVWLGALHESGQIAYLEWQAAPGQKLGAGSHTIAFQIDPYWFDAGAYTFIELVIEDTDMNRGILGVTPTASGDVIAAVDPNGMYDLATAVPNTGQLDVTVNNSTNVSVTTVLTDPLLIQKLENMPEGGIAYIDCTDEENIAYAEIFRTIAGRDKTVIFAVPNGNSWSSYVLWVFNGLDVAPGDAKDVNLGAAVHPVSETDGEKEVKIDFAHHGTLPGKAAIEVFALWAADLYDDNGGLHLWHEDGSGDRAYMGSDVRTRGDRAVIFGIDHCSAYILSTREDDTPTPTPTPTAEPSAGPTAEPSAGPTAEPSSGPSASAAPTGSASAGGAAKTGDDTNVVPWIVLVLAAAGIVAVVVVFRLRAKKQKK